MGLVPPYFCRFFGWMAIEFWSCWRWESHWIKVSRHLAKPGSPVITKRSDRIKHQDMGACMVGYPQAITKDGQNFMDFLPSFEKWITGGSPMTNRKPPYIYISIYLSIYLSIYIYTHLYFRKPPKWWAKSDDLLESNHRPWSVRVTSEAFVNRCDRHRITSSLYLLIVVNSG